MLSLTTQWLNLQQEKVKQRYNFAHEEKRFDEQSQNEYKMLKEDSKPCLGYNRPELAQQNLAKLASLTRNVYYDPEVMETVLCSSNAVFYSPIIADDVSTRRIRRWIRKLRSLSQGQHGLAIQANYGKETDFFIVKTIPWLQDELEEKDVQRELYHEWFIGHFGTNKLRKVIPNFAYVYGLFECGQSIFQENVKDVVSYCRGNKLGTYLAYENVSPAITWQDYVTSCSEENFNNIYLQMVLSIIYAAKKCKFTHNDLHHTNVLIRDLGSTHQLRYPHPSGSGYVYIKSKVIATIIDYGYAYIEYKEQSYPPIYHPSVIQENFYPIADLYKILCYSLFSENSIPWAMKIMSFFTSEDFSTIIWGQNDIYYNLPYDQRLASVPLAELYEHILVHCPVSNIISEDPWNSIPVFYCDKCSNKTQLWGEIIGATEPLTIPDLLDQLDYYYFDPSKKQQIKDAFPTESAFQTEYERVSGLGRLFMTEIAALPSKPLDIGDSNTWQALPQSLAANGTPMQQAFELAKSKTAMRYYHSYVYQILRSVNTALDMLDATDDMLEASKNLDIDISNFIAFQNTVTEMILPVLPYLITLKQNIDMVKSDENLKRGWLWTEYVTLLDRIDAKKILELS